jgi:pyridoxine 5-phosphate synthase
VEAAAAAGAQQVELHTGEYCHAAGAGKLRPRAAQELGRLADAARLAHGLGLSVAAGHGLTQHNLGPVVAIPEVREVNIGHAVIADAVLFGLDRAVRDLRAAVERGADRPRRGA